MFLTKRKLVRGFMARAQEAREANRLGEAGVLYEEALRLVPDNAGLRIQCGHMLKEIGELERAEAHYREAQRLTPDDPDLALQMGHFYKVAGRFEEAASAYKNAIRLAPDWAEPAAEYNRLRTIGLRVARTKEPVAAASVWEGPLEPLDAASTLASAYGRLAPEIRPRRPEEMLHTASESINLRQFGVRLNTFWGVRPVLRGVEAIRGFCISETPILEVRAFINGLPIHRGPLEGGFELEYEPDKSRIHKYVFNIWCDVSPFVPGQYRLELQFRNAKGHTRGFGEHFVVETPLSEAEHPDSDATINLVPGAPGSIVDQINARPSVLHAGARPDLRPTIRSILVLRADQLGDLVASIPALIRLRELFPDAKLVGVFGPANVDLARTLTLFDDIVTLDYREDLYQRTRTLSLDDQEALRAQLAPYRFDIAIDLSQSRMSRPLLALSGAPFLYGFHDPDWPRLTASVDDAYHDPKNRHEIATHSTRVLNLVERLGNLMSSRSTVIRRDDLSFEQLAPYGLRGQDRYAVLHTGARIAFSRWPGYLELATLILERTDLKLVLFTGDVDLKAHVPPGLRDTDRFIVIDKQLPFDDFDALVSFATVFVGNDSGPKHLASLRGVNVVSIHSARINWSEWGQELTGVIVTRKVPCAGCLLYHDVDECGQDYVCVKGIKVSEVYDAVHRYI